MESYHLQLISALTALVAVVVGPIVTLYVARKQIKVSVLAKNRQDWINTLRNELSEVTLAIRNLELMLGLPAETQNPNRLWELAEKAKLSEAKIRLLINPEEKDHVELVELIRDALVLASKPKHEDRQQLEILENKIIEKSQAILKREWERVKALE